MQECVMSTNENGVWTAPQIYSQRVAKYGTMSRLAALLLRRIVLFVATLLIVMLPVWSAGVDAIAVIYPDIGQPYRGIFNEIIKGIEDKVGTRVSSYPVSADTDIAALRDRLLHQKTKVVIALGRQGMKTATALNDGAVVVGGVLTVPENEASREAVVTLSPDPALLFARIKTLMPMTKRIFVVYDPGFNNWIIKLAKDAAGAQGLELEAYPALDLRSAVQSYQKIFSEADSQSDVLWLPQDPTTVDVSTILPLVLQESWNRSIAVFSSNFGHVRRGVLFSLYPDNEALGKRLAGLAEDILNSDAATAKTGLMTLLDVQSAVNVRTAKHLGINPTRLKGFNTSFPE
jgi:putative ABC transport system substrate-binding protein